MKTFSFKRIATICLLIFTSMFMFTGCDLLNPNGADIDRLNKEVESLLGALADGVVTEDELVTAIVYENYNEVVSIQVDQARPGYSTGSGSGVIVAAGGYIATNWHVIEGASLISIKIWNQNIYWGAEWTTDDVVSSYAIDTTGVNSTLVAFDKEQDYAIIKIDDAKVTSRAPAVVRDVYKQTDSLGNATFPVGETVIAMGNGLGTYQAVSVGHISSLIVNNDVDFGDGVQQMKYSIIHTADTNPGNSGGPLYDLNGNLIGLNTGSAINAVDVTLGLGGSVEVPVAADGLRLAISIQLIVDALAEVGVII